MRQPIKTALFLLALALPLPAQEGFDFKTLDKLGAHATNRSVISLDGDMLKFAAAFLGDGKDPDSLRPLVDSLKGIYIRAYEFDRDSRYNEADLEPLRAYLKQTQWNRIVEWHEAKETSEIYLQPLGPGRLGGVAIISANPRDVTVVYISGNLKQEDIAKLSGTMGIPDLPALKMKKPAARTSKSRKVEDER